MEVFESVSACIGASFGNQVTIEKTSYVGGGDINDARCLLLSNGERVFMKSNSIGNKDFFIAEESGLNAIASTGAIKTPKLLGRGVDEEGGFSFLMMEYTAGTKRIDSFWETFGHELAAMHLSDTSMHTGTGRFGFESDNFIGASKQINTPKNTWIDFFRECRLEPQFIMASDYFSTNERKEVQRLLDKLDELLVEPECPSLLHGDLWSGNYVIGNDGKAWLIDPAVYVGYAEADLAMTELFGRFPGAFYSAYSEVNPIDPGYKDRKDLYNLYHLFNHLNLFGPSYLSAVKGIVEYYI